ncbi:lipoate--protein ligase family protein [Enterococcus rivorum]|uniref:Lipoyl-[GcvH]:protein N-lipoyltransferase n=1 Tax=Enterococcus rivorum TaxID=762845 RepID=A0A1E5KSW9_9ENTE|nr:lipoate--protein ligase family protein [Enterococcus rivorum]MBP2098023.1 octanoyl-[GcvH]:protein N-octanoyltransferase [Enterococcus rivorum]OEH80974.1 lipoate--protein ligase [Enterococcus rivorum]
MNEFQHFFSDKNILVYDQGCLSPKDYYTPFALTDVLTTYSGVHNQPIIHFWQLDRAMILGMKDTRVTHLDKGICALKQAGYPVILRNSGGLGVIADKGILNVSLILPNLKEKKLEIDYAYTLMWAWLKSTFQTKHLSIDAFEITDSYCPGTFDLSINGKKFAGIAQRRVKDGIAVMIYLSVNGDQKMRGESVRRFYQASLGDAFGTNGYPPVNPSVMANLDELTGQLLTINKVKEQLLSVFLPSKLDDHSLIKIMETEAFQSDFNRQLVKMKERNNVLNLEE